MRITIQDFKVIKYEILKEFFKYSFNNLNDLNFLLIHFKLYINNKRRYTTIYFKHGMSLIFLHFNFSVSYSKKISIYSEIIRSTKKNVFLAATNF
jgi:hypothetical protein